MCGSMVDIQSATAEIRRRKKKKEEEETTGWRYSDLPYSIATREKLLAIKLATLLKRRDTAWISIPLLTNWWNCERK